MAGKRVLKRTEDRDEIVDRLMHIHQRPFDLETLSIDEALAATRTAIESELRDLAVETRRKVERAFMTRVRLAGRLPQLEIEALARRTLARTVVDFTGAMWALSPKARADDGWHASDPEDQRAIEAVHLFIHRHALNPLVKERHERHFADHNARLQSVPREQLSSLLDELGREREARTRKQLREDWEWIAARLAEDVGQGPVRQKDVLKVLNLSDAFLRGRRLRKKTAVTTQPRKKRRA